MVSKPAFRVGINQFLVISALMQAPDEALSASQLKRHFDRHRRVINLSVTTYSLVENGAILWDEDKAVFRVTERGRDARCMRSKRAKDAFLKLETNENVH